MNAAEVLRNAAAEIQRRGLNQNGNYWDSSDSDEDDCKVCAYGAISVAVTGKPYWAQAGRTEAADEALREQLRADGVSLTVPDWNDEPQRTADDVALTLLRAADRWESEHPNETPPSKGDGPFLTPLGAI